MTALRLLVCSDAFLPAHEEGGPPFSTFNLCRALSAAGAEVRVVTTDRNGRGRLAVPTDGWTQHEGLPVWYARSLPGPFYPAPSAGRAIRSAAECDCIISSGTLWSHLGLTASRAARRHAVPNLVLPRGLLDPWALAHKAWRKRLYWNLCGKRIVTQAAAVVTLTAHECETVRSLHVARRIDVVPNGVDVKAFLAPPPRSSLDDVYPALLGQPYVLFLGRVHEKKGLPALLASLAHPALAGRRLALVVAGPVDDGYRSTLDRIVAEMPDRNRLLLTGPVSGPHKAALLAHATAFVLPSLSEGLPMSALEALASGCPTILTAACNLPEVSAAGAGIEVPPDAREIAGAIARLLSDPSLRADMGARGRTLASERFDSGAVGKRMLSLCQELAAGT